jgi:imidazolonepropionase-like amidohydrolase
VRISLLFLCALSLSAATVIRCGSLLDVRKGELIRNAVIVVEKGVIQGVNVAPPGGAEVIDLSRGTCMPGLMDVHDHLTDEPTQSGYEGIGV